MSLLEDDAWWKWAAETIDTQNRDLQMLLIMPAENANPAADRNLKDQLRFILDIFKPLQQIIKELMEVTLMFAKMVDQQTGRVKPEPAYKKEIIDRLLVIDKTIRNRLRVLTVAHSHGWQVAGALQSLIREKQDSLLAEAIDEDEKQQAVMAKQKAKRPRQAYHPYQ